MHVHTRHVIGEVPIVLLKVIKSKNEGRLREEMTLIFDIINDALTHFLPPSVDEIFTEFVGSVRNVLIIVTAENSTAEALVSTTNDLLGVGLETSVSGGVR
jgi:hypothetical protein